MSKNKKNNVERTPKAVVQTPASADPMAAPQENIVVKPDDALKIKQAEEAVLMVKLQLSDIELTMSDLSAKKQELINQIRQNGSQMMSVVRAVAESYGIDPDGKRDDTKWNLNTSDMIFYRVQ